MREKEYIEREAWILNKNRKLCVQVYFVRQNVLGKQRLCCTYIFLLELRCKNGR